MRYNVVTDKNDINFQCFTTSFPFSTLSFYFLEILPSSFSSVIYHFAIDENHLPGANLFCIIGNVCCILCSKLIKMKRYFLKKLSNYLLSQLICFWIRTIPFLPLRFISYFLMSFFVHPLHFNHPHSVQILTILYI